MARLPLILQNPRPSDFFGPDDYTGGNWEDDARSIRERQFEWDEAYAQLTSWQRLRYRLFGWH